MVVQGRHFLQGFLSLKQIEGEDDNESGAAAAANLDGDDDDAAVLSECSMPKRRGKPGRGSNFETY